LLSRPRSRPDLHSFPTRRSSDLAVAIRPIQGAAIALQLAADRAAAAAKHPRDRSCRVAFLPQQRQRIPIRRGELAVRHGWLSFLAGAEIQPVCQFTLPIAAARVALSM